MITFTGLRHVLDVHETKGDKNASTLSDEELVNAVLDAYRLSETEEIVQEIIDGLLKDIFKERATAEEIAQDVDSGPIENDKNRQVDAMELDRENVDQSENPKAIVKEILDGVIQDISKERITTEEIENDMNDSVPMETDKISQVGAMEVDTENVDQSETSKGIVGEILAGLVQDVCEETMSAEEIAQDTLDRMIQDICVEKSKPDETLPKRKTPDNSQPERAAAKLAEYRFDAESLCSENAESLLQDLRQQFDNEVISNQQLSTIQGRKEKLILMPQHVISIQDHCNIVALG